MSSRVLSRPALALLRPLALLRRASVAAATWTSRRHERAALSRLDPHLLSDIGLDQVTAAQEAQRPFWQA